MSAHSENVCIGWWYEGRPEYAEVYLLSSVDLNLLLALHSLSNVIRPSRSVFIVRTSARKQQSWLRTSETRCRASPSRY